jgi:hypothetical protein
VDLPAKGAVVFLLATPTEQRHCPAGYPPTIIISYRW